MRLHASWCVTLAALTMAAPTTAFAQRGHGGGVVVTFGLGYGQANSSCDGCVPGSDLGGITAFAELGHNVNRALRLGATVETWWHTSGGTTEQLTDFVASAHLYPFGPVRLFLTGGVGLSNYHAASFPAVTGTGWGYILGVGYDLPGGHWSRLTPIARYVYGNVGNVGIGSGDGSFATGWKQHFFDVGLGLTFR